jgi:hypothetical protein
MRPTIIGIITSICAFGGVLLGMRLRARLREHHITGESKETVKVGIGLIATMTALVLGLITASAKSSYDAVNTGVQQTARQILALDRGLARYGPETQEIRKNLKQMVGARIDMTWPKDSSKPVSLDLMTSEKTSQAEGLADAIRGLEPRTDLQRELKSRAIELAEAILQARLLMHETNENPVPAPLLVILLFWLTITFTSFGVFSKPNVIVMAALFLCSLSVGAALFLVLEMESPFEGLLKVSARPLIYTYQHLNQ